MKILLIVVLLVGCSGPLTPKQIRLAKRVCKYNGGIALVQDEGGRTKGVCRNGVNFNFYGPKEFKQLYALPIEESSITLDNLPDQVTGVMPTIPLPVPSVSTRFTTMCGYEECEDFIKVPKEVLK